MSAGKFLILVVLSFMIIALVCAEVASETQVARLTDGISFREAQVTQSERQQEMLRQMLQRLAVASLSDPALAELLQNHGIHINRQPVPAAPTTTPATAPASAKPAPPDVPPVAQ